MIDDITMAAPALEKYAQDSLADLWQRPGLTLRDRSIATVTALIKYRFKRDSLNIEDRTNTLLGPLPLHLQEFADARLIGRLRQRTLGLSGRHRMRSAES